MANAQKAAFFEKYAPIAMVQQQKYGIPASITLAQMYLESGGGTSKLAVNGNNYFGIKCSKDWLDAGKPYSLHNDDRPNEKFCNYSSVEDSVLHHSQFLMGNRYRHCRAFDSTDYAGWARGLQAAGYATNKSYASILIADIESYGLQKYDQQAVQLAQQQGVTIGYAKGQPVDIGVQHAATPAVSLMTAGNYCYPIAGDNLVMSDGFGKSSTSYRDHTHHGIDLRAKYQDVFATEDNGRVVDKGYNKSGGNFVIVEYDRAGGAKYRISYCHLDKINVEKGDAVNAGTKLGVSGNTGNSTGPHLHLTVNYQGAGETALKTIDPLKYLAEISVRGNLLGTVLKKGTNEDLLANIKGSVDTTPTPTEVLLAQQTGNMLTPQQLHNAQQGAVLSQGAGSNNESDLLSMLLAQNKEAMDGGDIISSLVKKMLMGAVSMALILDNAGDDMAQNVSDGVQPAQETEEEKAATLIHRQRESVNPAQARDLAQMNFDAEYPVQQQSQGQRLA